MGDPSETFLLTLADVLREITGDFGLEFKFRGDSFVAPAPVDKRPDIYQQVGHFKHVRVEYSVYQE